MTDEVDGVVIVPTKSRARQQSVSRHKTRIDKKARSWIQQNIKIKKKLSDKEDHIEVPTDGFGEIDFKGATRRAKAKFVRFSDTTPPADIFNVMTKHWHLEKPRLVISVSGGAKSFNLDPKLKQILQVGILKVAQTPGAWVITGGTNTGVMQQVGEALQGATKACIGISTYGIVTNRHVLLSSDKDENLGGKFPYQVSCSLVEKGAYLDHNHTHHLMVDDGSEGKFGAEINFRSRFEKYIMEEKVPAVLLIVQGGVGTIHTVWTVISEDSPISIVVVKDSGKAADIFAYAWNLMKDADEYVNTDTCHADILEMIHKSFPTIGEEEKNTCCEQVMFCMKKREAFTIFQMGEETGIDEAILMALLNGQKASPMVQLRLTLLWDRAELAKEKILSQTYDWKQSELDFLMIMSLAMDRVDFVKLLLEYGVSIELLLTNDILEFLYGFQSHTCSSTLKFEFDEGEYTCADQDKHGDVISLLCGFNGFNPLNCAIPRKIIQHVVKVLCKNVMSKGDQQFIEDVNVTGDVRFKFPYRELFFWAVLNNKHKMAMYLWEFEEEAMSKALIAAEINTSLFEHAQKLDLPDDLVKSFLSNAREFKDLALRLLDECYRMDEDKTVDLITTEFNQFPNQTCLGLAVDTNDLDYVAHSSVQYLLNEVWTGYIKMRECTDMQLLSAFLFPPLINNLAFYPESVRDSMVSVNDDDDDERSFSVEEKPYQNGTNLTNRGKTGLSDKLISPDVKSYGTLPYYEMKKQAQMPTPYYKKFYLFYFKTPVIKFYANVISYFVFLFLFAYVCLLKKETELTIPEYLLNIYVVALTVTEIHQISQSDSNSLKTKLNEWSCSVWNKLDAIAIIVYFVALGLRLHEETQEIGHVMFAIDGGFWVVRLLNVFFVHRILGPYVVMIYRMTYDLLYFMVILSVFLFSYGVTSKAILYPRSPASGLDMVSTIIFHPYFNIYGELFIDRDPQNNATTRFGTPVINSYSETIAWILLGIYLLITNVLLMNLLIAIFNNTFNDVQANAAQIWKFERHGLVIEYEQRVPLTPPFSLIAHLFMLIRWGFQTCGICEKKSDGNWGLKSLVTNEQKEELIEFENKCMAMFVRKRESMLTKSLEEASVEILAHVQSINTAMCYHEDRLKEIEVQLKNMSG